MSNSPALGLEMTLSEWLEQYPLELLVHTWDLAQATGQPVVLDPDLVRPALQTADALPLRGVRRECWALNVPSVMMPMTRNTCWHCSDAVLSVTDSRDKTMPTFALAQAAGTAAVRGLPGLLGGPVSRPFLVPERESGAGWIEEVDQLC